MSTTLDTQASPAVEPKDEFKDLGFGAEVARGTRRRLLNRDGSFNVTLDGLNRLSSLGVYQRLLRMTWSQFLAFICLYFVCVNALFAGAFLLCGQDALQTSTGQFANQPFYRAFFFSVDTFATIGYGNIYPVGVPANSLVSIEA